jgi:hypothetical protein
MYCGGYGCGRLGRCRCTATGHTKQRYCAHTGAIPLIKPIVNRTLGLIRRRWRVLSPAAEQLYQLIMAKHGFELNAKDLGLLSDIGSKDCRAEPMGVPRSLLDPDHLDR